LYVCEIKFSQNRIETEVIAEVKEKIKRMPIPKGYSVLPVLIHVNGISDALEDMQFFSVYSRHCGSGQVITS